MGALIELGIRHPNRTVPRAGFLGSDRTALGELHIEAVRVKELEEDLLLHAEAHETAGLGGDRGHTLWKRYEQTKEMKRT